MSIHIAIRNCVLTFLGGGCILVFDKIFSTLVNSGSKICECCQRKKCGTNMIFPLHFRDLTAGRHFNDASRKI